MRFTPKQTSQFSILLKAEIERYDAWLAKKDFISEEEHKDMLHTQATLQDTLNEIERKSKLRLL